MVNDVFGLLFVFGADGFVIGFGVGLHEGVEGGFEGDGFDIDFVFEEVYEGCEVFLCGGVADDGGLLEGVADFDADFGAEGASVFDEFSDLLHGGFELVVDEGGVRFWVGAEVDAFGHGGGFEVLVHGFGDEWGEGCEGLNEADEDGVEGVVGGLFVGGVLFFPEAFSGAAEVPVAEVFDEEVFDVSGDFVCFKAGEVVRDAGEKVVEAAEYPLVEE